MAAQPRRPVPGVEIPTGVSGNVVDEYRDGTGGGYGLVVGARDPSGLKAVAIGGKRPLSGIAISKLYGLLQAARRLHPDLMLPRRERPPWIGVGPTPLRSFAGLCLVIAGLCAGGFLLTKTNPNAGLFLVAAAVSAGLATVALAVSGLRHLGGAAATRSNLVVICILVVALATPW